MPSDRGDRTEFDPIERLAVWEGGGLGRLRPATNRHDRHWVSLPAHTGPGGTIAARVTGAWASHLFTGGLYQTHDRGRHRKTALA